MGPTLAILLRHDADIPTPQELLEIGRSLDPSVRTPIEISIRSTASVGGDVHVNEGRPFGFSIGGVGLEKEEVNTIEKAFGFVPTAVINVFAYANALVDHRILAQLGIFFARRYGGIVDFGGNLGAVKGRSGTVVEIPYLIDATPAAFHVSDVAFLEEWLAEASFHMIK